MNAQSVTTKQQRRIISLDINSQFMKERDIIALQATTKGHIITHRRATHEGRKYACSQCGGHFAHKSNLTAHQKVVHMQKTFPGQSCDYKATQQSDAKKHQKRMHNKKN